LDFSKEFIEESAMANIVKTSGRDIVGLLRQGEKLSIPKPFARQIRLTDVYIAGTTHIRGIEEIEPRLEIGAKLEFFREPDNPHDPLAIVVKDGDGNKLGYIPQNKNDILSRLMDAGKLLFGSILSKERVGNWLKITIRVFLDE
jgi:hypothetical protein